MSEDMTEQEFNRQADELLEPLPLELHSTIIGYAWQASHSYGHESVLNTIRDLVDDLEKPVKALIKRVQDGGEPSKFH